MTADKPLRADARRKREALLATARELFDAGGFFDLRFDDFARLAGVGTGTLYRHFPTREALAEAVYHGEVAALCDRARQLQATLPAPSPPSWPAGGGGWNCSTATCSARPSAPTWASPGPTGTGT
jgi:AcrR family transcriptional regulator